MDLSFERDRRNREQRDYGKSEQTFVHPFFLLRRVWFGLGSLSWCPCLIASFQCFAPAPRPRLPAGSDAIRPRYDKGACELVTIRTARFQSGRFLPPAAPECRPLRFRQSRSTPTGRRTSTGRSK